MVKTTQKSDLPSFAIFSVIVYFQLANFDWISTVTQFHVDVKLRKGVYRKFKTDF